MLLVPRLQTDCTPRGGQQRSIWNMRLKTSFPEKTPTAPCGPGERKVGKAEMWGLYGLGFQSGLCHFLELL